MPGLWTKLLLSFVAWLLWLGPVQASPGAAGREGALSRRTNDPEQASVKGLGDDVVAEAVDPEEPWEMERERLLNHPGAPRALRPGEPVPPEDSFYFIASREDPRTIRLRGGLLPNQNTPATGFSLWRHNQEMVDGIAEADRRTAYVSAFRHASAAKRQLRGQEGFLYAVHGTKNMIDIDRSLWRPIERPGNEQYAVLGGARWGQVTNCYKVTHEGELEHLSKNEEYDALYDMQMTNTGVVSLAGFPVGSPQYERGPWGVYQPGPGLSEAGYAEHVLKVEAVRVMEEREVGQAVGWRHGVFPLFEPPSPEDAIALLQSAAAPAAAAAKARFKARDASFQVAKAPNVDEALATAERARAAAAEAVEQLGVACRLVNDNAFLGRHYFDNTWHEAQLATHAASTAQYKASRRAISESGPEAKRITQQMGETADASRLEELAAQAARLAARLDEILARVEDAVSRLKEHRQGQVEAAAAAPDDGTLWLRAWEERSVLYDRQRHLLDHQQPELAALAREAAAEARQCQKEAEQTARRAEEEARRAEEEARKAEEQKKSAEGSRPRRGRAASSARSVSRSLAWAPA
ncbi:putative enterotoxin [Cordyceps sp. RAO-2017]|nr:putative enterotoxin [Cordyceps sp. RAO-2017]